MENTSGGGSKATVPGEIDKWNWGAFLFTWIWGVGNDTTIYLLMFVINLDLELKLYQKRHLCLTTIHSERT